MKKLVVFLFVALLSVSTFANNAKPVEDLKSSIRTEIVKLLGHVNFSLEKNTKTTVEFMINKKGQIIVLDVDSKNTKINSFVKSKLNYKFIAPRNLAGKTFKMPLTLVKR